MDHKGFWSLNFGPPFWHQRWPTGYGRLQSNIELWLLPVPWDCEISRGAGGGGTAAPWNIVGVFQFEKSWKK